jgi:hypothetical protein
MKRFQEYLKEAIVDPKRETLSPQIFNLEDPKNPKLHEEVKNQIMQRLAEFTLFGKILEYKIIGGILTRRYLDNADLDVNVLINLSDENLEKMRPTIKRVNGKTIKGTLHSINYHVLNTKVRFDNASTAADDVFDVENNKFIKRSKEQEFNIDEYMADFQKQIDAIRDVKEELKDDLIDYVRLKSMSQKQGSAVRKKIASKIKDLENSAQEISAIFHAVSNKRRAAFLRTLTPKEIQKYGSYNKLPANVIFKLLERNFYMDFLRKVDKILGDNQTLSKHAANKLVSVAKND